MRLLWPVLALLTSCAMADYQAGIDASNRGDHDRALSELSPGAGSGDSRAQRALSHMYPRGLGVPKTRAVPRPGANGPWKGCWAEAFTVLVECLR
jgi:hypothetical protein